MAYSNVFFHKHYKKGSHPLAIIKPYVFSLFASLLESPFFGPPMVYCSLLLLRSFSLLSSLSAIQSSLASLLDSLIGYQLTRRLT